MVLGKIIMSVEMMLFMVFWRDKLFMMRDKEEIHECRGHSSNGCKIKSNQNKMNHLIVVLVLCIFVNGNILMFAEGKKEDETLGAVSLLENGDFSQYSKGYFKNWHCYEESDTRRDLRGAKYINEWKGEKNVALFQQPAQGMIQPLFISKRSDKYSISTSSLVLSLKYCLFVPKDDISSNSAGKGMVYLNIKYDDGTILPVWLFTSSLSSSDENTNDIHAGDIWHKECIVIPGYGKRIENIVLSVGSYNLQFNEEQTFGFYVSQISLDSYHSSHVLSSLPCQRIIDKRPQNYKTEINAFTALHSFKSTDVTIVTQLTIDRLDNLLRLAQTYGGPISASLFLTTQHDYHKIQTLWLESLHLRNTTSIHLIYDNNFINGDEKDNPNSLYILSLSYPVNYLRNIARKFSNTLYILYLDADFIVPKDLFQSLTFDQTTQIMKRLDSGYKSVIVLPAYQTNQVQQIPKNRQDLLLLKKERLVQRISYPSQRYVDFDRYEEENNAGEEFYEIKWDHMLHFEPYFIQPKSTPLFSERFIGGARDKLQQTLTTHLAGFRFFVWKKFFICHLPHPPGVDNLMSGGWPPKRHSYLSVSSHYYMIFREFYDTGTMDFDLSVLGLERKHKREKRNSYLTRLTLMEDPSLVHNHWIRSLEEALESEDGNYSSNLRNPTDQQLKIIYLLMIISIFTLVVIMYLRVRKSPGRKLIRISQE